MVATRGTTDATLLDGSSSSMNESLHRVSSSLFAESPADAAKGGSAAQEVRALLLCRERTRMYRLSAEGWSVGVCFFAETLYVALQARCVVRFFGREWRLVRSGTWNVAFASSVA